MVVCVARDKAKYTLTHILLFDVFGQRRNIQYSDQ